MSEDAVAVRCSCCGQQRRSEDVARSHGTPEVVVCRSCAHDLAGQLAHRPVITPIFPVHDMAAVEEFWRRAGLQVEEYSPDYAFVTFDGAEVVHLALRPDLDLERNAAACYVHVDDPVVWHQRWAAQGLPVSAVRTEPWGMVEFSVADPSGNLLRIGRNE